MAQRLDSLTGLRIFAAGWVMLLHFRDISETKTWSYPFVDEFIRQGGNHGVDLFFVLSGFILSHVYFEQFQSRISRTDLRSFISFRFARLYPVHLFTLLVMVALFIGEIIFADNSTASSERFSQASILSTLTMTHAWWGTSVTTPNVPAWSISAEWFAYLLFPVLCLVIARLRQSALIFAASGLGLAVLWQQVASFDGPGTSHALIRVMAGFLVGMATYQFARRAAKFVRVPVLGTIIVGLIVLWVLVSSTPRLEIGLALFAALVFILASGRDWLGRVLSLKAIVYLGEISYAVYMVHWVVRLIIRDVGEKVGVLESLPPGLIVAADVTATMLAAVLIYHLIERPWRRRLRRLLAPRSTDAAAKAPVPISDGQERSSAVPRHGD